MSELQVEHTDNKQSYRNIFKATSLFGGVQVYNILISIIKTKFVAVLLGTSGMGIMGLYSSTISLIQGFTNMGLEQSAVRDVSAANASGSVQKVGYTVAVLQKLVWFTGLFGMLVMLIFAPYWSKLTFGNGDYTIPFVFLSVILLLNQISVGQKVVLQGMRRLKDLAKSSAIGATIGLFVSVPLYYWLGIKGIVPVLIMTSVTALLLTWYYSRKVNIVRAKITIKQAFQGGQIMMKMGLAMTLSSILTMAISYLLRWFIRYEGGIDEVGLFTAGYTIINTYTGLVFTAMATDYYPRLAAVSSNNKMGNAIVNQQIEVALLIICPLMALCIVFMPLVVRLIYSDRFLDANIYILWAAIGIIFKAISWSISYNFIAKGEAKQFMANEVISKIYEIPLELLGFYLMGLEGLGIATLLFFLIYTIQLYIVANKKFEFSFSKSFIVLFIPLFILVVVTLIIALVFKESLMTYLIGGIVSVGLIFLSLKELEKRMSLVSILKNRIIKK